MELNIHANRKSDSKMRKYFATLHTRPDHHKKRFALLVSGTTTLAIFAVWTLVRFGTGTPVDPVVATAPVVEDTSASAGSPLQTLRASASDAWSVLSGGIDKAKEGLQAVDLQNSYTEVRNGAIGQSPTGEALNNKQGNTQTTPIPNTYGQQ
jgi:hypothetical protein